MDNKKILTTLGIIVIVIIAITVGAFVWQYEKNMSADSFRPAVATPVTKSPAKPVATQSIPAEANASSNIAIPADWKTYQDDLYGISFQYPNTFTLNGEVGSTKNILDFQARGINNEEVRVYTNSLPFYNPPAGTDVTNWIVNKQGKKFEDMGAGYFYNKIGAEFKIDNLPTLHLINRAGQDYPNDEFYFIKDNKLYQITISNEKNVKKRGVDQEISNVDIANNSAWYMQFLQSFKFTNQTSNTPEIAAYNAVDIKTKGVWDKKIEVGTIHESQKATKGFWWAKDRWDWISWQKDDGNWTVLVSTDGFSCKELDAVPSQYADFFKDVTYRSGKKYCY